MPRYSWLLTILNLVLFFFMILVMMMGWVPDALTGMIALALMIVIMDVILVALIWRRQNR
ncbi:MAG: hypothetical protein KKA73_15835 [Chloroflexi bacterium]|nr:hypothetical protein [Chloroflexota bacterium]MBU1749155.1 hypothetical protein [Chloroflexota bacterium]MBU1878976.1 hypothetical protein [Chloroflexota bacterium]